MQVSYQHSLASDQYVLVSTSAFYALENLGIMNNDDRIVYAEILDAVEMQTKSCDCSSFRLGCTSMDADVSLRCGCYDHIPTANSHYYSPFCYIHDVDSCGSSDSIIASNWRVGTYFKDCDDKFPNEANIRLQWYLNLIHWPIYNTSINGNGIVIAIIDDGLDTRHSEFDTLDTLHMNYIDGNTNPTTDDHHHGTACAGIAAAKRNQNGIVGVAYKAKLVGYRLLNYFTTADEEDAFKRESNRIHIKSNSWGPFDDPHLLYPMSYRGKYGMAEAIQNGRHGKGTIFVFAAGNGGQNNNNCNSDGYANSMYTIAVTSVSAHLRRTSYGEECSAIVVSAPSSEGEYGMYTTDVIGTNGYSSTDYTDTFGGTSASAPIVSGVVALMLQTNNNLNWRDVQEILLKTARKNAVDDTDWIVNGAGINYNHRFGAGVVNAVGAVEVSRTWNSLSHRYTYSTTKYIQEDIFDMSNNMYIMSFSNDVRIEHVELTIDIEHAYRLDLDIRLQSPFGTISRLTTPIASNDAIITNSISYGYTPSMNSFRDYSDWTFTSVMFWGERSTGDWRLYINDVFTGNNNNAHTNYARLTLHGTRPTLTSTPSPTTPPSTPPPTSPPISKQLHDFQFSTYLRHFIQDCVLNAFPLDDIRTGMIQLRHMIQHLLDNITESQTSTIGCIRNASLDIVDVSNVLAFYQEVLSL